MADINGTGMGASLSDLMLQYLAQTNPQMRSDAMGYYNPASPLYQQPYGDPDAWMLPPGFFQMPSVAPPPMRLPNPGVSA